MGSTNLLNLCKFVSELKLANVPHNVVDHAKLVLVDTLGVIVSGYRNKETKALAKRISGGIEKGKVTCPGRARGYDLRSAALINGMAGSSMEFEEGNSRAMGHPAIQIVPALVAEAECQGASGDALLSALITGYEVACRVSRASSMRRGLHPNGTWGIIGAALGVGYLRNRRAEALVEITNLAASYALSPFVKNSFSGYNVSTTFAGLTNYLGLISNDFFDSGIQADPASFEMTFSKFISDGFDAKALTSDLGQLFAISENYFKPYPTCRFTQPALDAVQTILNSEDVDYRAIESIEISSFKAAVHGGKTAPRNVEAMRFSVPFLVAALLLKGKIDADTLSDDLMTQKELVDLAGKVEMVYRDEYERIRPEKNAAHVKIRLKGGRELSHEILSCRGDPLNPLAREELLDKFSDLVEPVIGIQKVQVFLKRMEKLEFEENVCSFLTLLRPEGDN